MENEILQQILNKLDGLEQGQAETIGRLDKLEQGQVKLEQGQTEAVERLDKLEQRQLKTEILFEHEVVPNVKALAEIYGDHTISLKKLEAKLDNLSTKVDIHTLQLQQLSD